MKNIYKTIFLLILNSTFSIHNSFSQTAPGIEWQKCYGGSLSDFGYSNIIQTYDGGYGVVGYTESNDGNVSGNHGDQDYWIIKLDSIGNLQWQKCLGGSNNENAFSIRQTSDSGYVISGWSASINGNVNGNHGQWDCWIVKLNKTSYVQWKKCLGGTYNDAGYNINLTHDNGYIIAGASKSNDGDVSGNHDTIYTADFWVVKLDHASNIIWQKCLGGTNDDWTATFVQETNDYGFIIGGHTYSNDGDVSGNHGSWDYWIVKLDSAGGLQWQKALGGDSLEFVPTILLTQDGGYLVGGLSLSNNGNVTNNHGNSDCWLVKLDSAGSIEWEKCFGGSGDDACTSINQTNDGNYIIGGCSTSNDGDVTVNHGDYDYWILKIDTNGNLLWQKSLGGSGSDMAMGTIQTQDGGYIMSGYSISNDNDVSGNHGAWDYWIVKLFPDTITGISNLPSSIFHLQFSPNPLTTQSKLTFKNNNKEKFLFTLYDITGRVTESVSTTNNEIILTKGGKPAGVYMFNLMNEKTGEGWNGKIVVSD